MTKPILTADSISITFGGLNGVEYLDIQIDSKEVLGLIGPNGAGKTTVFNMLTGVYTPTEGTITLGDQNITGKPTHTIVEAGLARTFQNIRLFKYMSVLDNVLVAQNNHMKYI